MPIKFTTAQFIEKAKSVHGDRYDYSHVDYVNSLTLVDITCTYHGAFKQQPGVHLKNHGGGCYDCGVGLRASKKTFPKEEFIRRARAKHANRYDYSHIDYVNMTVPITIICPIHRAFTQSPYTHIRYGCQKCSMSAGHIKQLRIIAGDIPSTTWKKAIGHAATRNLEFNVTAEDGWRKYLEQDGKCALTGAPIGFRDDGTSSRSKQLTNTASLDRIDSKRGYVPDNIQWVHKRVNIMNLPRFAFLLHKSMKTMNGQRS